MTDPKVRSRAGLAGAAAGSAAGVTVGAGGAPLWVMLVAGFAGFAAAMAVVRKMFSAQRPGSR